MFSRNTVSFGRGTISKPTGALLIILLLALALSLQFFVGMARYDDYEYAQAAYNLANGVYRVSGFNLHHQARLTIVVPVAVSFRLFGVNEQSAEVWPLLCALGSIVLIFYLGKLLFDQITALIAALLLSFFPLGVVYSTQLLPDIIQPFFLALSVLCFLKGHDTCDTRASSIWFSLSWLSVGMAFFTRESGVVILLFHIAFILYNRTVSKEYLVAGAVVAAFSLVIGLIYLRSQGNPLAGLQYISGLIRFGTVEHLYNAARHFANRWPDYIQMLATQPQFVYFTAGTAVGLVYLVWRRGRHIYVPALWLLTLFLYLEVLSSLHYMRRLDRYLTILTIPALLIVARFLAVIVAQRGDVVDLPVVRGFLARIRQQLGEAWLRKSAVWARAIFWGAYAIAISLLLASILFSPSFVRDHLSPDGILEANTVSMIQQARFAACGSGTILTIALLISRKWGWLDILAIPAGILAKMVVGARKQLEKSGYRRLMVGFIIGFLFVTSVGHIAVAAPRRRYYTFRFREAGHFLASLPPEDIYLPEGRAHWFGRINFYLGFETGYNLFNTAEENEGARLKPLPEIGWEQIGDSYVVIDPWVWEDDGSVTRQEAQVPGWWEELMRITYAGVDTVIYYTGQRPPP